MDRNTAMETLKLMVGLGYTFRGERIHTLRRAEAVQRPIEHKTAS